MRKTKVLVTGATGFLGKAIMRRFTRPEYAHYQAIGAPPSCSYDLTQSLDVAELLFDTKPDVVIHAAAVVGGIGANQRRPAEFLYENTLMSLNLLHLSYKYNVKKFVQIGTVCSYPKYCQVPFKETDIWNGYPEETNAPYGNAKRLIMEACQAYRKQYGFNAITVIPTNMYGPGDNFGPATSHVIPAIILKVRDAIKSGAKSVELWGTGNATRDFLYVEDAVTGILNAVAVYNDPVPVNLGTGLEWKIRVVAEAIAEIMGYKGELKFDATKPDGQPRRCVDTKWAEQTIGWSAPTPLRTGLENTIEWFNPPMITAQAIY